MFGYVRPFKAEMLVREYEEYKAVYCTLCREIGKNYGRRMRLALNYDLTFVTILGLHLSGAAPKVRKGRCVVNPTKKCNFLCEGEEAYKMGSALTVLMTYQKLIDNINDEGFIKRTGCKMLLPFIKGPAKKAAADYPEMSEAVEALTREQAAAEKDENASIDACCEPSAKALEKIFSLLSENEMSKRVLGQMGYFLGRWVYLMDAADDLADDMKDGSFNPFIKRLGLESETVLSEEKRKECDESCNEALNNNVAMINSAVNLLPEGRYGNIIENVTGKGLAEVQREILFLHIRDKKKKKEKI